MGKVKTAKDDKANGQGEKGKGGAPGPRGAFVSYSWRG